MKKFKRIKKITERHSIDKNANYAACLSCYSKNNNDVDFFVVVIMQKGVKTPVFNKIYDMNFFSLDHPQLRKMALFDAVINNTDRKIGHLLPTHSGEVLGCDHGVTFHTEDKLRTVLWQWAGNPLTETEIAQLENLLLLIDGELKPILEELITAAEIDATITRINRLIDSKVFPLPSQEWPPVPWPAF